VDWLAYFAQGKYSEDGETWLQEAVILPEKDGFRVTFASGTVRYVVTEISTGIVLALNANGAQVRLTGKPLTVLGVTEAYRRSQAILGMLGTYAAPQFPNRLDVAVDVSGFEPRYPLKFRIGAGSLGRPPKTSFYGLDGESGTFESCTAGSRRKDGSGLQVTVYDKTKELDDKNHDELYLLNLLKEWHANGYQDGKVWRIEFTILRHRLESFGVTLADLLNGKAVDVLGCCLSVWEPSKDVETIALWKALRATQQDNPKILTTYQPVKTLRVPSGASLAQQYVRLLARYAASRGISDFSEAALRLHSETIALDGEDYFDEAFPRYAKQYERIGEVNSIGGTKESEEKEASRMRQERFTTEPF